MCIAKHNVKTVQWIEAGELLKIYYLLLYCVVRVRLNQENLESVMPGKHMVWKAPKDDSYVNWGVSRRRTRKSIFSGISDALFL